MSIDLSEFHDVFFEECFEGIDVLESGLLNLDQTTEIEEINAIFRAAHSIKGGSASFGFTDISNFTHVMETLLDEMRDGRRDIAREVIDLLLLSVDVLRGMVNAARDDKENDRHLISEVQNKLETMLAGKDSANTSDSGRCDDVADTAKGGDEQSGAGIETVYNSPEWRIDFKPHDSLLQEGFDPVTLFRDIRDMGVLTIEANVSALPLLQDMIPETGYLEWSLQLSADIQRKDIENLFFNIADQCDLQIEEINPATPAESDVSPEDSASKAGDTGPDDTSDAGPAPSVIKSRKRESGTSDNQAGVAASSSGAAKESGSIRVSIDKVDELINLVGELVITQSMLSQTGAGAQTGDAHFLGQLRDGLIQLERNTRDLQESVLQMRMLPISFSFNRFPRLVRDLSGKVGKQVDLVMTGEQTEVDKTVLEKIGDPLVHLVRNSLDHGIEMPDVRRASGKCETGKLELCAYHEGGDIIIQVIDDGAGLNRDRILKKAMEKGLVSDSEDLSEDSIYNLIFAAGFSTAEQLSDISGRGVGMDVVRRNVRDLGGNVSIKSNSGHGSTVTIRLPLTLAILDGQLVRIGNETYIIPLISIVESLQMNPEQISSVAGEVELFRLRDEYIPIIRLNHLFNMKTGESNLLEGLLVVVESDGRRVGLFVDDLQGQQQVVIKSLETNLRQIQGVSGATILGDGTIALIMDVAGLIQRHLDICHHQQNSATPVA